MSPARAWLGEGPPPPPGQIETFGGPPPGRPFPKQNPGLRPSRQGLPTHPPRTNPASAVKQPRAPLATPREVVFARFLVSHSLLTQGRPVVKPWPL